MCQCPVLGTWRRTGDCCARPPKKRCCRPSAVSREICAIDQPHIGGGAFEVDHDGLGAVEHAQVVMREIHRTPLQRFLTSSLSERAPVRCSTVFSLASPRIPGAKLGP